MHIFHREEIQNPVYGSVGMGLENETEVSNSNRRTMNLD